MKTAKLLVMVTWFSVVSGMSSAQTKVVAPSNVGAVEGFENRGVWQAGPRANFFEFPSGSRSEQAKTAPRQTIDIQSMLTRFIKPTAIIRGTDPTKDKILLNSRFIGVGDTLRIDVKANRDQYEVSTMDMVLYEIGDGYIEFKQADEGKTQRYRISFELGPDLTTHDDADLGDKEVSIKPIGHQDERPTFALPTIIPSDAKDAKPDNH